MFLMLNDKSLAFINLRNVNSIRSFSEKKDGIKNINYLKIRYKNGECEELLYEEAVAMARDLNKFQEISILNEEC